MLPKWHILFTVLLLVIFKISVPNVSYLSLFVLAFASIFVDFDHYLSSVIKTGKWNLVHILNHNYKLRDKIVSSKKKRGVCEKGEFHIFHTIEAHLLIGVLGIFVPVLFFAFIGMIFHSLLDIVWMVKHDVLESREFFFFNRLRTVFF